MAHTYVHIWVIPYGGHLPKPKHLSISAVTRETPSERPISWIWISNLFWCITMVEWIWPVQLIRSHQSTEASRVHSCCIITYIQFQYSSGIMHMLLSKMSGWFNLITNLAHWFHFFVGLGLVVDNVFVDNVLLKLLLTPASFTCNSCNITDNGKFLHLSRTCWTQLSNKPVSLHLMTPFSIMTQENKVKVTIIS